jgi:hypothetical protein
LPGVLHADAVVVVHTLPLQQPLGHEVASQMQLPPEQRCPPAQIAPVPQEHAPPLQPSARVGSQAMQPEPGIPHCMAVTGVLHVAPEQQPPQLLELQPEHAPPEQLWPPGQVWHARPPAPHALGSLPGWQVLSLAQHPDGHEVGSQMHAPFEQR